MSYVNCGDVVPIDRSGSSTSVVGSGSSSSAVGIASSSIDLGFDHSANSGESGGFNGIDPTVRDSWKDLEFNTPNDAYNFYVDYGNHEGFGVRIYNQSACPKLNGGSSAVYYIKYCCNKEGWKRGSENNPDNAGVVDTTVRVRNVPELRGGCNGAYIRLRWFKEFKCYKIYRWCNVHNHDMIPESLRHYVRSSRRMAPVYKMLAEVNDAAGIGVTSSYNAISRAGGGRKFVGFTKNDMKNHLRTVRTLSMEYGDATALLEYFRRQAQLDPGFFHEVEVDVEENIASIFWADGKMRMDYHYFGDSISFDTTYRTNKEYRPLALFVGFNNHHQLTVFAAALLYDETTATFEWLFDQFLKCMGGVRPLSMFTDQAAAIAAGIRSVFPDCFHGLCTWHIAQNAVVNLGSLCDSDFLRELSYLMYNADDEDDFEYNWKKMIEKCFPGKGPLGHSWLQSIYKVRTKWSSAWVNCHFGAGMKSTQLSECCNSNIRHYLQSEFSVSRFFVHFERMLDNKRDAEEQEEYYALSRLADSRFSTSPIVKQVANVYTRKIFKFFLDQYKESLAYNIFSNTEIEPEGVGLFDVFILEDDLTRLDSRVLKVDFETGEIKCSCRKWESSGMICKHQIKGYDMLWSTTCNLKFQHIPSSLILKRWTRAAKTGGNFSFEVPSTDSPSKYRSRLFNLSAVSASMISRVALDDDLYKSAMAFMTDLIKKCEALSITEPTGTSTSSNGDNDVPVQKVKGFKPKKDSFKPSKRPIPVAEAARAVSKKKRKTSRLEEENLKAVEESLRLKL